MAEPAPQQSPSPAEQTASEVGRLAQRAIEQQRPLFLLVFYRHEGEKLDFLAAVRQVLRERGIHGRTLDPAHDPSHGTGKLYPLLAQGGDQTVHVVADLARDADGAFEPAFLDYLNLHRDRINRENLRWILLVHESDSEAFLRQAGDLWDFRQRTFWLERPPEPRGEGLWQELDRRAQGLPMDDENRRDIQQHIETVKEQAAGTERTEERAALLDDLATWLLRRYAAAPAAEAAFEGLALLGDEEPPLRVQLHIAAGQALRHQELNSDALRHFEEALRLSREAGIRKDEAFALNEIAGVYQIWGRPQEALARLEQSLAIDRELEDRSGEAITLNNISQIYDVWGRYEDALGFLKQSLAIQRELGDRSGEAITLNNISQIYGVWGRYEDAVGYLKQSLAIQRELGGRSGESATLNNLSLTYRALGRNEEALANLQQSLAIAREIGNRSGEAVILTNVSGILDAWGRKEEARSYLQQSLAIVREIGDRQGEARTLNNIAQIEATLGRPDVALASLEQSLAIRREMGDRAGEMVTSWNLGLEYQRRGDLDVAIDHLRRAVRLEEDLDHPDLEKDRAYLAELEKEVTSATLSGRPVG